MTIKQIGKEGPRMILDENNREYDFPAWFLDFLKPLAILNCYESAMVELKAGNKRGIYSLSNESMLTMDMSREEEARAIARLRKGDIKQYEFENILAHNHLGRASLSRLEACVECALKIFSDYKNDWVRKEEKPS